MKNSALIILILLVSVFAKAQNASYQKTMDDLVKQISETDRQSSLQPIINKMERVAAAEKNEWLPKYWVAYCYGIEQFTKSDAAEKDLILDKADKYLGDAENLSVDNDEIMVLKAQLASARLAVDPMSRWQTYGASFSDNLKKATKLNSNNPRIYYLQGTNLFYTPENFGGGKAAAKPLFEQALDKFNNFEAKSSIYPNWGKVESQYFLSQCQ